MYISVFFLQPSIFLTRVRTATPVIAGGVRWTREGCAWPPTATATIRSFYKMPLSWVGCARAWVQIAIVRITMPPPDDECYWITPPIQPRYRTHRSVRLRAMPGNTSNTINCRRYDLGDDDKPAACSIKTPKRSIYRGKIHFRRHLEFIAPHQFARCVPLGSVRAKKCSRLRKVTHRVAVIIGLI